MMTKNLLTKGMAVIATMGVLAACSHDNDVYQPTKEETMANAKAQLGVDIDPNHDWRMTASATAKVTVNMTYGETYTVQVYSNDPLVDGMGYVLTKTEVQDGQVVEKDFEYPSALKSLVVSITTSKGFTSYKNVPVVDGQLNVSFGTQPAATRSVTRSQENPEVPHIIIPDDAYAKSFLEGAREPDNDNIKENDATRVTCTITQTPTLPGFNIGQVPNGFKYNPNYQSTAEDKAFYDDVWAPLMAQYDAVQLIYDSYNNPKGYVDSHNQKIDIFLNLYNQVESTGRSSWMSVYAQPVKGAYVEEGAFVKKFKITGTWNNFIDVLASEGDLARTVYISGKWTLPGYNEQRVGGGAVIVVDKDGELEIPQGGLMTFVNEARLVVMPGGKITGGGKIVVTNGNAEGLEGYNGGSIDIGTFNNNFGKFYNYGTFKANEYQAGSTESNFYNHSIVYIDHSGIWNDDYYTDKKAPNARIFNACQWYCANDMTCRNIEMTSGSYMYVGRELMVGASEDGTTDPSYVSLAAGALIRAGWLDNNLTIWQGPTTGYAVVEIGKVKYLNWDGDGPLSKGYFMNNIAVSIDTKDNACLGHSNENAYKVFSQYVANGVGTNGNATVVGNGGMVMVEKGKADVSIPASNDFEAGVKGCTPGYNGTTTTTIVTQPNVWCYAFEDTPLGDYDMNDVVIKVSQNADNENKLDVTLCCTGASFDLKVWLNDTPILYDKEVHEVLGQAPGSLVNTGKGPWATPVTATINKPAGFSFADADFWIATPAVPAGVHIAKAGEDPHGVVIPEDWAWPVEYVCIKDAYPDFVEFAKDASVNDETIRQWYKNPVKDLVVTEIRN